MNLTIIVNICYVSAATKHPRSTGVEGEGSGWRPAILTSDLAPNWRILDLPAIGSKKDGSTRQRGDLNIKPRTKDVTGRRHFRGAKMIWIRKWEAGIQTSRDRTPPPIKRPPVYALKMYHGRVPDDDMDIYIRLGWKIKGGQNGTPPHSDD